MSKRREKKLESTPHEEGFEKDPQLNEMLPDQSKRGVRSFVAWLHVTDGCRGEGETGDPSVVARPRSRSALLARNSLRAGGQAGVRVVVPVSFVSVCLSPAAICK
jgi:hypothetical protein